MIAPRRSQTRPQRIVARAGKLLSLFSLLLCGMALSLWVRSHWTHDLMDWERKGGVFLRAYSGQGRIVLIVVPQWEWESLSWSSWPAQGTADNDPFQFEGWESYDRHADGRWRVVAMISQASPHALLSRGELRFFPPKGVGITMPAYVSNLSWSMLTGLSALLPACQGLLIVRGVRRRRKWAAHGCCMGCGYSLTGNTSGGCPECGSPVPGAPVPQTSKTE